MNTRDFKRIVATLTFVIKNDSLLMGQILGGSIAGYLTPPGGKRELYDKTLKDTAHRELFEETGLYGKNERKVASVEIVIEGDKRIVNLHIYRCTEFTGRIKTEEREFSYLKFFKFKSINWGMLAPGDETWMKYVLRGERVRAKIICGRNRADLREVHIVLD